MVDTSHNPAGRQHLTLQHKGTVYEVDMVRRERPEPEDGIRGGRITKLRIQKDGRTVARYDREWGTRPVDTADIVALAQVLRDYN